jgi:DNA-binding transcriptional ArsR family regulator
MQLENIENNVEDRAQILKALSNENRLKIICALYRGEKSVGALERVVGISQSALSQHLSRLRRDKLVKTRREAQTIYYSINIPQTQPLIESLCRL